MHAYKNDVSRGEWLVMPASSNKIITKRQQLPPPLLHAPNHHLSNASLGCCELLLLLFPPHRRSSTPLAKGRICVALGPKVGRLSCALHRRSLMVKTRG